MHLNCCVEEDSWRVPWTSNRSSQYILKEISPEHSLKGWCWRWNSKTLATWSEELTHWKRPWYWEGLGIGEEGDNGGWGGWMASPTQWTCVWVDSRSWWRTGRPGVLRFMELQRVGHDWVTELNWTELNAVAAAKLFQSCPTLCDPIDGSPPGYSVPGIPQARILEWVAISFSCPDYSKCVILLAISRESVIKGHPIFQKSGPCAETNLSIEIDEGELCT